MPLHLDHNNPTLDTDKNSLPGVDCVHTSSPEEAVDAIRKILLPELQTQIENLKVENENLRILKTNYETLSRAFTDQALEIENYKKKLKHAQDYINTIEQCKQTKDPRPSFQYEYNLMDFEDGITHEDINYFFNNLLEIANTKIGEGEYLIDCSSAIIPLYIMFTESQNIKNTKWHYCGTLQSFCSYWNTNIVSCIEDKVRAQQLHCNPDSIRAEKNKLPWKTSSPGTWGRKARESTKKSDRPLKRAINIKSRVEYLFKG